jgi:hypothetical protein
VAETLMRGLRSTIALVVVLVGLGAYIYFVTWKQTEDTTPQREKVFAALDYLKISELKVKAESGEVTTLKKTGEDWNVIQPIDVKGAQNDASNLAGALAAIDIERVIDENPTDLKGYGLDPPRLEVEFKTDDALQSGRLFVGAKTPTGGSMYVRRNDEKRVFIAPEFQYSTLNKTTFDLRDKRIMNLDRANIDAIDIDAFNLPNHPLHLVRTGTDWNLTAPIKARADAAEVRNLIDRISTTQLKSIAAESTTPAEVKKFGLDRPAATVTFHVEKERSTLTIGAKAGTDAYYVHDSTRPMVAIVDQSTGDDVKKTVDDLRRKELFDFTGSTVTRAEFTRGSQTIAFEKINGQAGEYKWRRVSPNPADADKDKVDSLLSAVTAITATSFVPSIANTGLNSPAMTVVAKYDDGKKEERVSFGKNGDSTYALVPGQPGAAKFDPARLADVERTLDELAK